VGAARAQVVPPDEQHARRGLSAHIAPAAGMTSKVALLVLVVVPTASIYPRKRLPRPLRRRLRDVPVAREGRARELALVVREEFQGRDLCESTVSRINAATQPCSSSRAVREPRRHAVEQVSHGGRPTAKFDLRTGRHGARVLVGHDEADDACVECRCVGADKASAAWKRH
jgi:hypothetical protein